jgi:hypothetical protein
MLLCAEMLLWGISYGALIFGFYLISLLWQNDWRFADYAAWMAAGLFVVMAVVVWQRPRQGW